MKILKTLPFRALTTESAGESLKTIPNNTEAPKNKGELITQAEALIKTVEDRITNLNVLLKSPNINGQEKTVLTEKLSSIQTKLESYKKAIKGLKEDKDPNRLNTVHLMQSQALNRFTSDVNALITSVNEEIADKFPPVTTTETPPAETKVSEDAPEVVDNNQLPSDVFVSILRPQQRPTVETPLNKDSLVSELYKLDRANDITAMNALALGIADSLKNTLGKLTASQKGVPSQQATELMDSITKLEGELRGALGKKGDLFTALTNSLLVADGYVTSANILSNRPKTRTGGSDEKPEKTSVNKEYKNMTEAERKVASDKLLSDIGNISTLPSTVGEKPKAFTLQNIKNGEYVGELIKSESTGPKTKLEKDFVKNLHDDEKKSIKVSSNNTFTYKDSNNTSYTVTASSNEGVRTRTKELPADSTKLLSDISQMTDSDKQTLITPILTTLKSQLESKGEKGYNVYLAIATGRDGLGKLTIKQMPAGKPVAASTSAPPAPGTQNERKTNSRQSEAQRSPTSPTESIDSTLSDITSLNTKLEQEKGKTKAETLLGEVITKLDAAKAKFPDNAELYLLTFKAYNSALTTLDTYNTKAPKVVAAAEKYLSLSTIDTEERYVVLHDLGTIYASTTDSTVHNLTKSIDYLEQAVASQSVSDVNKISTWLTLLETCKNAEQYDKLGSHLKIFKDNGVEDLLKTGKSDNRKKYDEIIEFHKRIEPDKDYKTPQVGDAIA